MRKIIIFLIFLIALTIKINAQIPNSGFENWINYGNYMRPQYWATTNIYSDGSFYPITRSTDHYPPSIGNYSVRIENNISFLVDTFGFGAIQANIIDVLAPPHPAFPIIGKPSHLTGYFKFFPQNGDTMHIGSHLYFNGIDVASGGILVDSTVSTWTPFVINYSPYATADSAFINITAYNSRVGAQNYPHGNSVLYIDNLNFDSPIGYIPKYNYDNILFELYPNPANTEITMETSHTTKESILTICSIGGQELIRQKIKNSKTQIDISNLTNGLYFVKLITEKTVEVRKIIKE
ncbi:MAG: T9SS type A sorting domain-containing protein [Bacteroidales bacterium]|nr:T9SS type A sorting domain-containing protein [Bacteroidales bacterium]